MNFILLILALLFVFPTDGSSETPFLKRYPLVHQKIEYEQGVPHYSLSTVHLPRNIEVLLMTRRLNGAPLVEIKELYINAEGDIVSALDVEVPFLMPIHDVALGEPIEFVVVPKGQYLNRSRKKPIVALGSIVARPLEVRDERGHTLSLHVASADGMHFTVTATGFLPREKIDAVVITERHEIKLPVRATKEGTFGATIAPAPIGLKNGAFGFEIRGATTEDLFVEHRWGRDAFNF